MDLSWPIDGPSVNSGIPTETYLENVIRLKYPTVDLLCRRAAELQRQGLGDIYGWKKDMERAFKQIPLEPMSWPKLGMCWQGALFFDKTAMMGCRSAPYVHQRTTNMIRHIMKEIEYIIYNYIDDFMSLDFLHRAWQAYESLGNLLRDLGVNEASDKSVAPMQIIEFLGVIFDFIHMVIHLPQDKVIDIV